MEMKVLKQKGKVQRRRSFVPDLCCIDDGTTSGVYKTGCFERPFRSCAVSDKQKKARLLVF